MSDASIAHFVKAAEAIDKIPTTFWRQRHGIFQANIGLWANLARQGQISGAGLDSSCKALLGFCQHPLVCPAL